MECPRFEQLKAQNNVVQPKNLNICVFLVFSNGGLKANEWLGQQQTE